MKAHTKLKYITIIFAINSMTKYQFLLKIEQKYHPKYQVSCNFIIKMQEIL